MKHSQLIVTLVFLAAGPAFIGSAAAHPKMQVSAPPQGGSIDVSPSELQLSFNEGVMQNLSQVDLKDVGGKAVTIGTVASDAFKKTAGCSASDKTSCWKLHHELAGDV
jgi:methionine-rich copper-binding protein CopC